MKSKHHDVAPHAKCFAPSVVNRPGGLLQGMFIIRYRLPPGHFLEIAEARLMAAVTKAHELRDAGHGDITITDDSDGLVQTLDWWGTIDRVDGL